VLQCVAVCCSVLQCAAVCCSVLQCVAVYCSVLQCVAVCCSVSQFAVMHEVHITFHHTTPHHTTPHSPPNPPLPPTPVSCLSLHTNTRSKLPAVKVMCTRTHIPTHPQPTHSHQFSFMVCQISTESKLALITPPQRRVGGPPLLLRLSRHTLKCIGAGNSRQEGGGVS